MLPVSIENNRIRFVLRPLFFLGVLFLLDSCSANPVSPSEAIGLLAKSKDLLSFCVLLLSQSDGIHYSHIAGRYYYAMLSLARIVAGNDRFLRGHLSDEAKKGKHERIWGTCSKVVEKRYGGELIDLRVRCDYGVKANDFLEAEDEAGLKTILHQDEAYNSLKGAVVDESLKISSRLSFSEEFNDLLDEIDNLHNTLKKKLKV